MGRRETNRNEAGEALTPMASIIHIVDDDEEFQETISRLLRAAGYEVRTYTNAGDFLLASIDDAPGCILLGVRMPGPSGPDLQRALSKRGSTLPIIFISGDSDVQTAVRAIKDGAVNFLSKPVEAEVLLDNIQNALADEAKNRLAHQQMEKWVAGYQKLTARELEVFERVVEGKMNKEIASELGAAERTVKAYRARLKQKLGANSLAELVRIAHELQGKGLTSKPDGVQVENPWIDAKH